MTVTGGGRRVRSISRRGLTVAVAALALAAALLAIGLALSASTAGQRVVRARVPAPASTTARSPAPVNTPARWPATRSAGKRPKLDADGDTDGLLPKGHFDQDDF